tara:strand:- start:957 stop:1700 length:744 start_codon:yes stop_codon:yes gene_type:complete
MKNQLRYLYRAWKYRVKLDKFEISTLRSRLKPGDMALDIGTHKGAYTYWMAKATGPTGAVISFEPQPKLAAYVKEATQAVGLRNVTVENLALSNAAGKGTIVLPDDANGSPSPGAHLGSESDSGIPVTCCRLDDYLENHKARPVRFIKCDVEGHELEVFRGAESVLKNDHPVILFECEERHRKTPVSEVFEYLRSLGYAGWFISPNGLQSIDEFDSTIHQAAEPGSETYINNFLFEANTVGDAALAN